MVLEEVGGEEKGRDFKVYVCLRFRFGAGRFLVWGGG